MCGSLGAVIVVGRPGAHLSPASVRWSYRNHRPLFWLRGDWSLKVYEVDIEIGARCAFLAANKKAAQGRIRRHMRRFLSRRPVYAYRIRIKKITEAKLRK